MLLYSILLPVIWRIAHITSNYSSSRKSVLEDLGRTQDFEELRALHKNCIEQDREIIETMEKEYLLLETAWEEPHYIVSHSILFHWEKAENEYGTVSWSFRR
jgi:hypothetical protein